MNCTLMQHICNIAGIIAAVAWETHSEVTLEERLAIITLRSALAPINCSRVGLSEEAVSYTHLDVYKRQVYYFQEYW